jgi:two-component system sensor histidine kinase DesK
VSATLPLVEATSTRRRAWWLLVAVHIPFVAFTVAQAGLNLSFAAPSSSDAIPVVLALAAGLIQLRHSLAAAGGMRPRYWRWTLLLLVFIAYAPAAVLGLRWATLQWYALASLAILLPLRVALPLCVAIAVVHDIWYVILEARPIFPPSQLVFAFSYWGALQVLGAGGLFGATRLVRLVDELRETRAELAELAIERERLRISRDLHDLLGQSLSAVSLKGDLAVGLLERNDVPRAVDEIESLVSVARSALRDVLDIAHREPPIALSSEIDRAADLLSAVGAETHVDVVAGTLSPAVDELFAWALREGVTNVLRHSSATTCSIRIARRAGGVCLEIVNDRAIPGSLGGHGLSGLAARASTLSGTASGGAGGDGTFRLVVDVPEVAR